jgi:hypothetical protein
MKNKTIISLIFICLVAAACATTTHYQPLPWAKMSFEQAVAQCRYDIQANPMIGFSACMEKYGWRAID